MNESSQPCDRAVSTHPEATSPVAAIAFIGGGNMAAAIIGGLIDQGVPTASLRVVDPFAPTRDNLRERLGVEAYPTAAEASLGDCTLVVWAVKPQNFRDAAEAVAPHTRAALHLSVAAGIQTDSIARWLGSGRVVRAMPNTPALVGRGMTGLFAREETDAADRAAVEAVLRPTGALLWMQREAQLDAVTALSGSGPAYVFYFLEAMVRAGSDMGLSPEQSRELAIGTFAGAAQLAAHSADSLQAMREKVTSRGGTTHAALAAMEADGVQESFRRAMLAAGARARELGEEFGG